MSEELYPVIKSADEVSEMVENKINEGLETERFKSYER